MGATDFKMGNCMYIYICAAQDFDRFVLSLDRITLNRSCNITRLFYLAIY